MNKYIITPVSLTFILYADDMNAISSGNHIVDINTEMPGSLEWLRASRLVPDILQSHLVISKAVTSLDALKRSEEDCPSVKPELPED